LNTSAVEHPAVLALCQHLEKSGRAKVHYIGVDSLGRLDLEAYRAALSDQVALVTFMWANNETGTIFPVEALAELAKEVGALFHTDAVQAVGKVPIVLKGSAIDMLSLSGHKFHAPKGIGALYIRKGVRIRSFMLGGAQERKQRAGTENLASIVGLGQALEIAVQNMEESTKKVTALRDHLISRLLTEIPYTRLNGHPEKRLPGNATTEFGAPDAAPSVDAQPAGEADLQRFGVLLDACWQAFDDALQAAAGKALRKGPRGGGRELVEIVQHVLEGDAAYLARLGWKLKATRWRSMASSRLPPSRTTKPPVSIVMASRSKTPSACCRSSRSSISWWATWTVRSMRSTVRLTCPRRWKTARGRRW
jgi:hypothetical protein